MMFHLSYELPLVPVQKLDHETAQLTQTEEDIIKKQIRKNSRLIDDYVARLDLLVNKEGYPQKAVFLEKIRRQLELLMQENDTFRKVLWEQFKREDLGEIRVPSQ